MLVAKPTKLQGEKCYHTPEGRTGRVLFDVMVHDNEYMLEFC
jgi:hypothetical protein